MAFAFAGETGAEVIYFRHRLTPGIPGGLQAFRAAESRCLSKFLFSATFSTKDRFSALLFHLLVTFAPEGWCLGLVSALVNLAAF